MAQGKTEDPSWWIAREIERRSDGKSPRDLQNEQIAEEKLALARLRSEEREANKKAWEEHLEASVRAHIHMARDARRRLREIRRMVP